MEAESLFNDGTAIVIFTIVLGMATGGELSVSGAVCGICARGRIRGRRWRARIGVAVSLLTRSIDDPMVEITLTVLSAYGAFIAAELLGLSGVIACVIAGMVTGNWGAQHGMRPATRAAVDAFWSYAAFLFNSFVFLLMGLEINLAMLAHYLPEILIGWVAINVARAALVYSKYAIMRARRHRRLSMVVGDGAELGRLAWRTVDGAGAVPAAGFQSSGTDIAHDIWRRALDAAGAGADHQASAALGGPGQQQESDGA